ncbi:acyltransferase [Paenisporosarcina cavernae]|uniref:Acyltransferase n=1 Tax=Paenisporosarcina cavernae TaxID=2320858 RepID=A0A385YQ94_9BACL|nr:acyltransferase [Paenisporosarcina cavernae]AYC28919.1 acyltransferase [Paenisporosarcina cavernae]
MIKQEIKSIYYLRLSAMMMVVLIHTTAQYRHLFDVNTFQSRFYHFINNITRVESGIFIMLVGIVFFYNYQDRKFDMPPLLTYWKKRVVYILIPFVVWSLVYEIHAVYLQTREWNSSDVLNRIVTGQSHYQLYFIFIVVQFYLVFPLVMSIVKWLPSVKKYLALIGIFIEFVFFLLDYTFRLIDIPFFLESFGSFLVGGWIGLTIQEQQLKVSNKKISIWGIIFAIAGIATVFIRYQNMYIATLSIPIELYRLITMTFIIGGSYFVYLLSEKLVLTLSTNMTSMIKSIAYYSFGFYLLHPLVLYYVMEWIPTRGTPGSFHLTIMIQYIFTLLLCYLIIWSFHRFVPFASFVFGKLPKNSYLPWQAYKKVN